MGFVGAAVSITISRIGQTVVYFFYMFVYKKYHVATWPGIGLAHHTRARTTEFLRQALPGMVTLFFQECAEQTSMVIIGQLGETAIAAKSVIDTVMLPLIGTLGVTTSMISAVRVGMHLGAGEGVMAKKSSNLVFYFLTAASAMNAAILLPLKTQILKVATNDLDILNLCATLLPAAVIYYYCDLVVDNATSGVLSGMGRPLIATRLSFFYELPMQIGGLAIYIFVLDGTLLGIFWMLVTLTAIESVIVLIILARSNWNQCAEEARTRQEADSGVDAVELKNDAVDTETGLSTKAPTSPEVRRTSFVLDITAKQYPVERRSTINVASLYSTCIPLPQDERRASVNVASVYMRRGSKFNISSETAAIQILQGRRKLPNFYD